MHQPQSQPRGGPGLAGGEGSQEMPRDGLWLATSLFGQGHLCGSTGPKGNPISSQQWQVFAVSRLAGSELAAGLPSSAPTTGSCVRRKPSCQQKLLPWSPRTAFTSPGFKRTAPPSHPQTRTHLRPREAESARAHLSLWESWAPPL